MDTLAELRIRRFIAYTIAWIVVSIGVNTIERSIRPFTEPSISAVLRLVLFYPVFVLLEWKNLRNARLSNIYARDRSGPGPARLAAVIVAVTASLLAADLASTYLGLAALKTIAPDYLTGLIAHLSEETPRGISRLLVMARTVIYAPVVEELLFRGFFFPRLSRRFGIVAGAVISSLFFAIPHPNIPGAFVFGIVQCILARRTRSLLVPTIVHALNNAIASTMAFLWIDASTLPLEPLRRLALPAAAIAVLSLAALWLSIQRSFARRLDPWPGDRGPDKPEPAREEPIEAYLLSVDVPGPRVVAAPDGREARSRLRGNR